MPYLATVLSGTRARWACIPVEHGCPLVCALLPDVTFVNPHMYYF
jgi:hypothetical protein